MGNEEVARKLTQALRAYIEKHGLKASKQREIIADVFSRENRHMTLEELVRRVNELHGGVGQATVYRTMKLLQLAGLAVAHTFDDGPMRFEPALGDDAHHDHIVCTSCGRITEFQNGEIEDLQREVANRHGFHVSHHKMEIYGLCPACQQRS